MKNLESDIGAKLNLRGKTGLNFAKKTINRKLGRMTPPEDKRNWKPKMDSNYNLYGYIPKAAKQKKLIVKTRKAMRAFKLKQKQEKLKGA